MEDQEICIEYSINGGEWENITSWDLMESPIAEERDGLSEWTDTIGRSSEDIFEASTEWDGSEITFYRCAYDHPLWILRIRSPLIVSKFLKYLEV